MSRIRRCDRCDNPYDTNNLHPTTGRIVGGYIGGFAFVDKSGSNDKRIDLCDDCISDLYKFMDRQGIWGSDAE